MDSLTQITLGAAVSEAVLGRSLGNRAILWGAAFGTLPDLDIVMTPFVDSVDFLVHHRGLSHSLFAVALATPVLSWVFYRWYRRDPQTIGYGRWFTFFLLVFLTHILLDCFTNYGTQIFMPFSDARVAWNSIFIIDPLYTVPLLVSVIACMFLGRTSSWRRRINHFGLALSTGYLLLGLGIKFHVDAVFAEAFAREQIKPRRFMTCPTPLNTVLWYGIAEDDQGYHVGFYSLLDSSDRIEFQSVPRQEEHLGTLANTYEVNRLIWFANGYYCVRPNSDGVLFHVMNFGKIDMAGSDGVYPFSYQIHRATNAELSITPYELPHRRKFRPLVGQLWSRLKGI